MHGVPVKVCGLLRFRSGWISRPEDFIKLLTSRVTKAVSIVPYSRGLLLSLSFPSNALMPSKRMARRHQHRKNFVNSLDSILSRFTTGELEVIGVHYKACAVCLEL